MKTKLHLLAIATIAICATPLFAKSLLPEVKVAPIAGSDQKEKSASKPDKSPKPKIEVCFVLDTTGSMSGLIEGAKQKIWSIANEMIGAKPTPDIKIGLVGYRDRGDEYVTKVFNLDDDIDAVYANLQKFSAGGGGDTPESVNEALNDAVQKMSWSEDKNVLKIVFLVGDAPPHMDYKDGPKYPEVCKRAMARDLIINTVQCGEISGTAPVWKEIAKLSEGSFAAIAQTGGMAAIDTPVDGEIAELNRKIGGTMVAYGGEMAQRELAAKQVASETAAPSVAADRLNYNFRKGGKVVTDESDLINAYEEGKFKLSEVKKDQLPKDLQKLSDEDLKKHIETQQKKREELQARIVELNKKRDAYIEAEKKKLLATGSVDGFDENVAKTIRAQAARKGIQYGK